MPLVNFELCHNGTTKLWAAWVNSLVAAMFIVAFFVGLGLLVGAFRPSRCTPDQGPDKENSHRLNKTSFTIGGQSGRIAEPG